MKKFIICTVLPALLLLTGCEKERLIDELETTAVTSATTAETAVPDTYQTTIVGLAESTVTTTETTAEQQEIDEGEELLIRFLERLKTGEGEPRIYYDFNPFEVYDFWDGFTVDSYSYEYKGGGIFDVTLTCSDSTVDIFPNGNSDWVFNSTYLTCFIPADREENHNIRLDFGDPDYDGTDSTLYTVYNAAVDFSHITGAFEADENWFANFDISNREYSAKQYVHWLYHAYNPYFVVYDYEKEEGYDVTPEEFAAAVKKLYNISITAAQARTMADETGFMVKNCGHGKSWLYDELAGFEETADEARVTVSYYGDSLYLYPAVQAEYTFSKNADGSVTLQNVRKIFDNGYELASGSV